MSSIALLFVGAVLLVNGLVFLSFLDPRSSIPINLFSGSILVLTAINLAWTAPDSLDERATLYSASGFALFGFTYLGVVLGALLNANNRSLGVYCGWSAGIALILGCINVTTLADRSLGILWFSWALLFLVFALALLFSGTYWSSAAGALAIYQSLSTATIPAVLLIHGTWSQIPVASIAIVQLAGVLIYGSIFLFHYNRTRLDIDQQAVLTPDRELA